MMYRARKQGGAALTIMVFAALALVVSASAGAQAPCNDVSMLGPEALHERADPCSIGSREIGSGKSTWRHRDPSAASLSRRLLSVCRNGDVEGGSFGDRHAV